MTLQEIIEDMGYECRSYSGRGMYGKECLGVVIDAYQDPTCFALMLGIAIGQDDDAPCVNTIRTDSMGLGTIVYFPMFEYVDSDSDSEEGEESTQ